MPIERKLAAIMFTDIAGYTALSAKDENKALALLDKQEQILTPIMEEFNGTLHNRVGDGLLFTFPTVTDAVKCGIKIQKETNAVDDLNLRIGIHEGEITLKDGDALGDDVNVASRIEAFSPNGGIAISSKVQQNISSLPEFETSYVGKPELKGVSQEVKVYCITSNGLPKAEEIAEPVILESKSNFNIFALTGGILTAIGVAFWIAVGVFDISFGGKPDVPSVGILMMENLGKEDEEFWSSGMTADLITKVAGAGLIRVAPLNDILKLDKDLTIEEKAEKLRVKYILTHSFLIKNDGFDLWCKLENIETGVALFSNKISEPMDMTTQMVGKLANDIITSLKVKTKQDMMIAPTTNTEAYEYYLKAKYKYEKRKNMEDMELTRGLLLKAIEIDEYLIEANELLGRTYVDVGDYEKALSIYKRVLKFAEKIENEVGIAIIKQSIAWVYLNKGDDLAIALEYGNYSRNIFEKYNNLHGIAHCDILFGYYYWLSGNIALADEYQRKANQFFEKIGDYNLIALGLINTGWDYLELGEHDNAMNLFQDALKLSKKIESQSGIAVAYNCIGSVYAVTGNYDLAIEYNINSLKLHETIGEKYWVGVMNKKLGNLYIKKGEYDLSIKYLNTALNIHEEIDNKQGLFSTHFSLGNYYYNIGQLSKARDNFIKCNNSSLFKNDNLDEKIKKDKLSFRDRRTLFIQLYIYKINTLEKVNFVKGKEQLLSLIKRYKKSISFHMNFMCYELFGDTSYLETAYNQVQEKADNLEPDVAAKFLNYPIPKAIVEEWEKVTTDKN